MNAKTIFSLAAASLLAAMSNAQHADGLNGSSFNGLWGLDRQPAAISLSRSTVEVNLFHVFADADNTYLHLEGNGSFGLFNFDNMLQVNTGESDIAQRLNEDRSISGSARVLGPSIAFRAGERSSFAITTGARTVSYATELDGLTRLLGVDTLSYSPNEARTLNELRFRTAAMAWGEIGASAAHRFEVGRRVRLHGGITGKFLLGCAGLYARNGAATLSPVSDSLQLVSDVDLAYGMSDIDAITAMNDLNALIQGKGFAMDAGLVFEWDRKPTLAQDSSLTPRNKYLVRFGVSVTDLGAITFGGGSQHTIINGAAALSEIEALEVGDIADLEEQLSEVFMNDREASRTKEELKMALPTMVHTSLDVNPFGPFFVNLSASIGLDRGIAGVVNPSNASITPRLETRRFEIGLPISFHQFQGMRMGMAVRVGPLVVGSDKLGGILGLTEVGGMDAFVGLKFNLGRR